MNIYGYVSDNPINGRDDWGLKKYCCKINTTRQTTTYIPPGMGILPPGYYNDTRTTCSQNTINAGGSKDPLVACKCKYKNQPNISVYDAHEGECKWCDVYVKSTPLPVFPAHWYLYIKCESWDKTFETSGLQGQSGKPIVNPGDRYSGYGFKLNHIRVSEKVATSAANLFKNLDVNFWDPRNGFCIGFAGGASLNMSQQCP